MKLMSRIDDSGKDENGLGDDIGSLQDLIELQADEDQSSVHLHDHDQSPILNISDRNQISSSNNTTDVHINLQVSAGATPMKPRRIKQEALSVNDNGM